jgi:pimeloyl-ACP methyl ester carboxylesterase
VIDYADAHMNLPPPMPRWLEAMFPGGMRRRMIDVGDGLQMHVAEWGSEAPEARPVLMVHGNPSWCFLYRKVVADLLADRTGEGRIRSPLPPLRLVVPDLIGLGCSDKPHDASMHTLENHGRWLGAALDALDLRDLVYVGQDWGGPVGLHALSSRLDRVRGMVILNTVPGPPKEGFRATSFHRFARMPIVSELVFRGLGFPQNTMAIAQGDKTSIVGRAALGYWWPLRHLRDRVAPLALARMVPDSMHHASIAPLRVCQDTVTSFRGPVAIVWGDRDPVLGGVIGHMRRLLPHATVTRTRGGHFLQEEVPGPIADAIRDVVLRSASSAGGARDATDARDGAVRKDRADRPAS